MIRLDGELAHTLSLKEQNHFQEIALLEHQLIEERIEDARCARHDIRHHIVVMQDYLDMQDYEGLKEYFDHYSNSLPDRHTLSFCQNRAIDSILLHYAQKSVDNEIDFQVKLAIDSKLSISDMDISVLLGNLLENAFQACVEYNGVFKAEKKGICFTPLLFFIYK